MTNRHTKVIFLKGNENYESKENYIFKIKI